MQETKSKLTKLPAPPAGGAGRKPGGSRAKNFLPLTPSIFAHSLKAVFRNFFVSFTQKR
jgi:hypothetical protein